MFDISETAFPRFECVQRRKCVIAEIEVLDVTEVIAELIYGVCVLEIVSCKRDAVDSLLFGFLRLENSVADNHEGREELLLGTFRGKHARLQDFLVASDGGEVEELG